MRKARPATLAAFRSDSSTVLLCCDASAVPVRIGSLPNSTTLASLRLCLQRCRRWFGAASAACGVNDASQFDQRMASQPTNR
jgi:hypothetical protein